MILREVIPNKDTEDVDVAEKQQGLKSADGKTASQKEEDKLMRSVLENDSEAINEGKMLCDAMNQGLTNFNPDVMFQQMQSDMKMAKQIHGEKLIRLLSGYDPSYLKRNIQIPEFARELQKEIKNTVDKLKKDKLLDKEGNIVQKGVKLASLILYTEELDKLVAKGYVGDRIHKKRAAYGEKQDARNYKRGDRYRNVAMRDSIKHALRRGHKELAQEDLQVMDRKQKGRVSIVYAMDASGSMKGRKIEVAKKAGIALAYKAIENKDKVGLMVFGDEIKEEVPPTLDFTLLLEKITEVRASRETNLKATIEHAKHLFDSNSDTKHLILLTDAVPTIGKDPEKETLEEAYAAKNQNITISVVGIDLDSKGKSFGEKLARAGEGRLYGVKDLNELDQIILEEYDTIK